MIFFYLMVLTDIENIQMHVTHTAGNWSHHVNLQSIYMTCAKMTLQCTINNGYVGRKLQDNW